MNAWNRLLFGRPRVGHRNSVIWGWSCKLVWSHFKICNLQRFYGFQILVIGNITAFFSLSALFFCFLLKGLTEDLKRPPDTLEDLKFVLRVIADIRDKSLEVELRYVDLQERYRTLLMYDIEVRRQTSQRALGMGIVSYQLSKGELFLITPFRYSYTCKVHRCRDFVASPARTANRTRVLNTKPDRWNRRKG